MEVLGLDSAFQPVKALSCINIQWNRRYYEAGDYQLQLRAADWDSDICYIYLAQRPETGMVEKVEAEHTLKGDFVLVSGFFLEGMLNWRVVYPRRQAEGNVATVCRQLAAERLAGLAVAAADNATLGQTAVMDVCGELLGDVTYGLLEQQECSQRIRLDYAAETLQYEVWQGENRTQSQTEKPYAVFSQSFGTVDAMTLTRDQSDYRNYAYAAYDGGVRAVDARTDPAEPVRELYVETGLSIADGQTQAAFFAAVDAAARAEMAQRPRLMNIDATVLQHNLLYLEDYDLGDRCDVLDDRLQLAFEARIIEVNEVWKDNSHTVALQFGNRIPRAYERGRG